MVARLLNWIFKLSDSSRQNVCVCLYLKVMLGDVTAHYTTYMHSHACYLSCLCSSCKPSRPTGISRQPSCYKMTLSQKVKSCKGWTLNEIEVSLGSSVEQAAASCSSCLSWYSIASHILSTQRHEGSKHLLPNTSPSGKLLTNSRHKTNKG